MTGLTFSHGRVRSVKVDTAVAHNEDQGADIELGGPEVQEETAAPAAEAEASTSSISDSKVDAAAATSAPRPSTNGGDISTSTGKRASGPAAGQSEDRSLPPSKRTRVAPPGGAQRRLFGVLTKTLSKFQEETKKDSEAVSSVFQLFEVDLAGPSSTSRSRAQAIEQVHQY